MNVAMYYSTRHYTFLNVRLYCRTEELLNPSSNDFYICVLPLFHLFAQFFNLLFSFRHGITNVIMGKFEPVTFLDNIQKYKVSCRRLSSSSVGVNFALESLISQTLFDHFLFFIWLGASLCRYQCTVKNILTVRKVKIGSFFTWEAIFSKTVGNLFCI